MAARKLTPKMLEALEYIDAYGNAGPFKASTLAALIGRGLIDDGAHGVRSGAEWNYRVTAAGAAVFSATQRRHLNGRFTVQPTVFAVGDLVNYSAMPLPEPFRVTAVANGLVEANGFAGVPSSFVKVEPPFVPTTIYPTDHAFALTVVGTSDQVSEDTGNRMVWVTYPEYPELAAEEIDPAFYTAYPKPTAVESLRAPVVPAACCSLRTRGFDCGCADAAADRLTGFEPEDDADDLTLPSCDASVHDGPGPEDGRECGEPADGTGRCADHPKAEHRAAAVESLVNAPTHTTVGEDLQEAFDRPTWHQHRLHGRVSGGTYLVLGSSIHKGHHVLWVQSEGSGGIFDPFRRPIPMTHASLRGPHCLVVACCEHRYNVTDSCPNCDALADRVADLVDRDTVPDREWPEVRAAAVKFIAERSVRSTSTERDLIGRVVRGDGTLSRATRPAEPEEESSDRLLWTDEWESGDHYRAAGFAVCYKHKPCEQRYYVNEYRTLGGLVRAMLSHNYLCGR